MINLAPFLARITELEQEVKNLKGGNERPAKKQKFEKKEEDLPPAGILSQFERRADEAEQRIKSLTELTTRMEQQLKSRQDNKSQPQASTKPQAGPAGKEKKKEVKGAPVSPFIALQQTLNKGSPTFILPLVHLSQKNEQYVCSICQETNKVFFACANDGCFHRSCPNCVNPCEKCGASICNFCGDCWKCSPPQETSLAPKVNILKQFFHVNAVHLAKIPGWPGLAWIDKALDRLDSWQAIGADVSSSPLALLLSFQWNSRGEIRALEFLLPILRALLLHTPITKLSTDRAQPKRGDAPIDIDHKEEA